VIFVDVDAALAAEYWGHPSVYADVNCAVMVALGTGVGYSVVIKSEQHLGHFGMLEGGHMIINPHSDRLCGCGQYGMQCTLILYIYVITIINIIFNIMCQVVLKLIPVRGMWL
jgi:predicted NBD/HSP70 family sugar kinase